MSSSRWSRSTFKIDTFEYKLEAPEKGDYLLNLEYKSDKKFKIRNITITGYI